MRTAEKEALSAALNGLTWFVKVASTTWGLVSLATFLLLFGERIGGWLST